MCHCAVGAAARLLGREGSGRRGLMGKRSDNQHVVWGCMWQGTGVGGARRPSWLPLEMTWAMVTNAAMLPFPPANNKIDYDNEDSR